MRFTIITPSFNQLSYLKRCVASVRDQISNDVKCEDFGVKSGGDLKPNLGNLKHRLAKPISVHHHVQDGGSSDGTLDWLKTYESKIRTSGIGGDDETPKAESQKPKAYLFSFESAPDNGMYDAISKGIAFVGTREQSNQQLITKNARDSVIAWLNCDEQYLPHTLEKVADFFALHPETDLLFGGMLMVDGAGELLSCRKALPMRRAFLEASYLYNYSCAMFFRESLWCKLGGLNPHFKNAGDEDLVRRAMKMGARTAVLNDYLSTFVYGDGNLSSDPAAVEEHERLKAGSSKMGQVLKLPINLLRLAEKGIRGGHLQHGAVGYEIYVDSLEHRTWFVSEHPSCRWPGAERPYLLKHRLDGG